MDEGTLNEALKRYEAELEVTRKAKIAAAEAKAKADSTKPVQQQPQAQDVVAKPVQEQPSVVSTAATVEQDLTQKAMDDQIRRYYVLEAVWQACHWGDGVRKTTARANEVLGPLLKVTEKFVEGVKSVYDTSKHDEEGFRTFYESRRISSDVAEIAVKRRVAELSAKSSTKTDPTVATTGFDVKNDSNQHKTEGVGEQKSPASTENAVPAGQELTQEQIVGSLDKPLFGFHFGPWSMQG